VKGRRVTGQRISVVNIKKDLSEKALIRVGEKEKAFGESRRKRDLAQTKITIQGKSAPSSLS